MWSARYFPSRYFAPRYWPKVGAASALLVASSCDTFTAPEDSPTFTMPAEDPTFVMEVCE